MGEFLIVLTNFYWEKLPVYCCWRTLKRCEQLVVVSAGTSPSLLLRWLPNCALSWGAGGYSVAAPFPLWRRRSRRLRRSTCAFTVNLSRKNDGTLMPKKEKMSPNIPSGSSGQKYIRIKNIRFFPLLLVLKPWDPAGLQRCNWIRTLFFSVIRSYGGVNWEKNLATIAMTHVFFFFVSR